MKALSRFHVGTLLFGTLLLRTVLLRTVLLRTVLLRTVLLGTLLLMPLASPSPVLAAPGLCVGPVCGDEITRSAKHHWQLRLRLNDQQGHRERVVVDCRSGTLSPLSGAVDRGYAGALARRACRLAGEV